MRRRLAWLAEHTLCVSCDAAGRVALGTEVDHITPLWQGGADDDANLQTLCTRCHAKKSAAEAALRAAGG